MAKKNKDDVPNPHSIPNRDIIQRLNFLYQASTYLNGLGATHPQASSSDIFARPTKDEGSDKGKDNADDNRDSQGCIAENAVEKAAESGNTRKRPAKRKATAHDLARTYVKSIRIIGQKTNVKMDPSVKRTLCKGCNTLLMPGVTAKVRVKPLPSHGHAVNYTCTNCFRSRRIPAPPTADQPYRPSPSLLTRDNSGSNIDPACQQTNTLLDTVLTETSSKDEKESAELHPLPKTQRRKKKNPTSPLAILRETRTHLIRRK